MNTDKAHETFRETVTELQEVKEKYTKTLDKNRQLRYANLKLTERSAEQQKQIDELYEKLYEAKGRVGIIGEM